MQITNWDLLFKIKNKTPYYLMRLKLPKSSQRIISIISNRNRRCIMDTHQNHLQKRRNCTLTTETKFNGKSINTNKEKGQSCIQEILIPIEKHLTDMLQKHSQVTMERFDLRPPQGAEALNNKLVGRIFENIRRDIKRKKYAGGHNPDTRIIGAPEDHGNGTHFHCLAFINGNAIQHTHIIHKTAEKYLGKALGLSEEETKGLVHYCNTNGENGITIRRGSADEEEKINQVMHQASYLAKERGKENTPQGQHLWVGTRVPKQHQQK